MSDDGALTVCTPCRLGKRKCDGSVPCLRCVARGGSDDCVKPAPKKRGRPLKPRDAVPELMSRAVPRLSRKSAFVFATPPAEDSLKWTVAELPPITAPVTGALAALAPATAEEIMELKPGKDVLVSVLMQYCSGVTPIGRPDEVGVHCSARVRCVRACVTDMSNSYGRRHAHAPQLCVV